jgi:hypothetical protein
MDWPWMYPVCASEEVSSSEQSTVTIYELHDSATASSEFGVSYITFMGNITYF